MTEPIARSNPGPIPHHEDWGGTGPGLEEVKQAQRPSLANAVATVAELAHEAVGEAGIHVVAEKLEHALETAGCERLATLTAVGAYANAGLEGTKALYAFAVTKAMRQGKALDAGRDADAARFVIAAVVQHTAPGVLPDGYLAAAGQQVVGKGPWATTDSNPAVMIAGNLLGQAENGEPDAIRFRDTMKRCVSEGVATAHAKNLRSPEALAALREHDAEFAKRWDADAGFQVGVRAAIWQAQTHPEQYDAAHRERAELQMTLQTARYA